MANSNKNTSKATTSTTKKSTTTTNTANTTTSTRTMTNEEFYEGIAAVNTGVSVADVKSLFIWYELLSYALPFQLIFIISVFLFGASSFPITMVSVLFIFLMDSILKNSMERDGKNFAKFNKHLALVKLWTLPLICMGAITSVALIASVFGVF